MNRVVQHHKIHKNKQNNYYLINKNNLDGIMINNRKINKNNLYKYHQK
jgi:hypothetical protein